jgi:hypothetical protein
MVSVTFVDPLPAARIDGENVAVAPVGSPLTDKVTAAGKVVLPTGLTMNVYTAVPPGITVALVTEALPLLTEMARLKSCTVILCAALVRETKLQSPL